MSETSSISNTRSEVWRSRVRSALRTTLACSIAGCSYLYGPAPLRRYLTFPAFIYSTTLLIVSDGTLGDTLRGCWHVLCASIQVMILSLVSVQVIGPQNFTSHVAALAMAASAFLVALPVESTHLVTKQIAFGQLVNVYVRTSIDGGEGFATHTIHVVCCTALGAAASVLAMLLPCPRLAYFQTRNLCRLYNDNISERLNYNIKVICASNNSAGVGYFSQAKSLSTSGVKLLQSIRNKLNALDWEQLQTRIFKSDWIDPEDKLQYFELPIRSMDIALSTCTFPVKVIDEDLQGILLKCIGEFNKQLERQSKFFTPFDATTTSEMRKDILTKNLSMAYKDLPASFFLYCMHLLLDGSPIIKKMDPMLRKTSKNGNFQWGINNIRDIVMDLFPSKSNLVFPLKSSLSLGVAVFLGLTYNKENGYWSGLTVAVCFVTGQHSTFSLANARGQGTAMGSIYGVLCCFIFQRFMDIRFSLLLPWVFFSSFLMYSRMYGKAGGISAVTGALLVIGINHDEDPSKFALARIVEATIGLLCFVAVEIIFNPFRASTLAKAKLAQCLRSLQHCIGHIAIIIPNEKDKSSFSYQASKEGHLKLKSMVSQLEEVTMEAELEPNFWFVPFHNACYKKMLKSLSTMADLLLFVAHSMENIKLLLQEDETFFVDLHDRVNENVVSVKNKVGVTLNCIEKITRIKSHGELENELRNIKLPVDIDKQEYPRKDAFWIWNGDEEVNNITYSFVHHLEEIANKICTNTNEEMLKCQMLFHYGCLGFCTSS
ncbi:hypothetical protein PHAVU_001G169100 [Phaseolus vulgaris]|uniref:Integral membrane bound transporter domain-containing protein n=1 Tax=Phaseolus vulgaris TaxID=3885 RepID=V7CX31_PHAVU|nr:hypothetical protein PHAVU_001G169100g [Phaseolus vulgaris]ESW34649.1 hypothetical protein PHAVU_001G169100g [Phaseolus vulgaris]